MIHAAVETPQAFLDEDTAGHALDLGLARRQHATAAHLAATGEDRVTDGFGIQGGEHPVADIDQGAGPARRPIATTDFTDYFHVGSDAGLQTAMLAWNHQVEGADGVKIVHGILGQTRQFIDFTGTRAQGCDKTAGASDQIVAIHLGVDSYVGEEGIHGFSCY
ncbi:hypothetical protein D3C87_1246900 [compost metagenome]